MAGPISCRQVPGSIGVLEFLDNPLPIKMANCIGWTDGGLRGGEGRWIGSSSSSSPCETTDRAESSDGSSRAYQIPPVLSRVCSRLPIRLPDQEIPHCNLM